MGRRMSGEQDTSPRLAPCFGHRTAVALSVSFDRPPRAVGRGRWLGSCVVYPFEVHGLVVVPVSVPSSLLRVLRVGGYGAGVVAPLPVGRPSPGRNRSRRCVDAVRVLSGTVIPIVIGRPFVGRANST